MAKRAFDASVSGESGSSEAGMDPWMNGLRLHARRLGSLSLALVLTLASVLPAGASDRSESPSGRQIGAETTGHSLDDILRYISTTWDELNRSASYCKAFKDTKTDGEPILYLPAELAVPQTVGELLQNCNVRVEHLPGRITKLGSVDLDKLPGEGLLYLENPYVVPGGQFNEMYGWDSYFIILGLLREHHLALAKGMVENFFFEIQHYGGVLNANRTYYLSRSQPPFLSSMILAVYNAEKAAGQADPEWLRKAYGFAVQDYDQWNEPPHLAGNTGLSRYFGLGGGPVPEIQEDPSHYYRGAAQFFLTHGGQYGKYVVPIDPKHPVAGIVGPSFPVFVCDSQTSVPTPGNCSDANVTLSADFYEGDRSMRESGFDVTFRFGPFGADTHHYAAVCLNSLLFKTETDLAQMSAFLGLRGDTVQWRRRALERCRRIDQLLWNERRGLYFDYDFVRGKQSQYEYATTFYPLWAGLASPQQARRLVRNLSLFEQPGGLTTSTRESGAQWDSPYGWAPIQLLAVEGLRRYGYGRDADRVAQKFLTTVLRSYLLDKTIREKYDVVAGSAQTQINVGYTQNVIGFGWTNGVFLELLSGVPPEVRAHLDVERPVANAYRQRRATDAQQAEDVGLRITRCDAPIDKTSAAIHSASGQTLLSTMTAEQQTLTTQKTMLAALRPYPASGPVCHR